MSILRRKVPRAGILTSLAVVFLAGWTSPCTLALISSRASTNGLPLMWKNRDASHVDNKLMYFKGRKWGFIAVINAEDIHGDEVWGGLNTAGFAIMNSQSSELASPQLTSTKGGNGALMKLALGECATVGDFENLLRREKGKFALSANFGVIDASGGACFFETGNESFAKFDAADSRTAPFGYIVRTNFAFTSEDILKGSGFIRFERISNVMEEAHGAGRISPRFILQEAARDLVHEKLHSSPLAVTLPDDPASPLYINTNDTINRNSSVSVLLFQGAPSRNKAHLATMWVILGEPAAGVAVPVWPASGRVPTVTSGASTSRLNDAAKAIVSYLYPDIRGRMSQYMNITRLRTYGGEGILPKLYRIENAALKKTFEKLHDWRINTPPPDEVAEFQESIAAWVYNRLREEFPDLVGNGERPT